MCSGSEAGSYLRLTDFVLLNSRLESHTEEEDGAGRTPDADNDEQHREYDPECHPPHLIHTVSNRLFQFLWFAVELAGIRQPVAQIKRRFGPALRAGGTENIIPSAIPPT